MRCYGRQPRRPPVPAPGRGGSRRLPAAMEVVRPAGWRVEDCPRVVLPSAAAADAERLFDLQVWCFGQDVVQGTGNGLVQAGFQRHPPPAMNPLAASYYERCWPSGAALTLWSFGCLFRDSQDGGIYVDRAFRPRYIATGRLLRPVWTPEDMRFAPTQEREHAEQAARRLTLRLVTWIAEYERWVARRYGSAFRRECLRRWPRGTAPTWRLDVAWDRLGDDLAAAWNAARGDWTREAGAVGPSGVEKTE